jgi:hypothetical protein
VPERVLSERELNRALLARQLLLERAGDSLPRALQKIGGIQAQYAPSMYVGLWSRLREFERDKLTRALQRRSVVQGTLMRSTIHLVAARDYWPFAVAVRAARRERYLRSHRGGGDSRRHAAAASRLRRRLRDGPLGRRDVDAAIGDLHLNGIGLWLDLVRVPPSGTWERRRADIYADAASWIGPSDANAAEGTDLIVRRYLGGFGPASREQIADWAGLTPRALAPALERLRLRRFRAEDDTELLDLPRAPLPDPETPAPARFLPVWDATLLAHARRSGILPERHRAKVFSTRTPQSVQTFLVDGAVAGAWRYEDGRVELQPFGRLARSDRRELEHESRGLAELHR